MTYKPTAETLAIVRRLGGHWSGRHAMVHCPVHEDRTPSLSIRQGRRSILVHCFAGCDGADIMRALRHVLGHPVADRDAVPELHIDRTAPFLRLWHEAMAIEGTLGQRYLRDVRGITFLPPDVRFHPRCPMGKGAAVRFLPALLVGVFRYSRLVAIQRLFLDPVTGDRTHRMMLGPSRGGIWPSRFAGTTMRVAEGFESACAYRQITGQEAGACFGTRNFATLEPAPRTNAIVLLPDNDNEGQGSAHRTVEQSREDGLPVSIVACPSAFADWADIIHPSRTLPRIA